MYKYKVLKWNFVKKFNENFQNVEKLFFNYKLDLIQL